MVAMIDEQQLHGMDAESLRAFAAGLLQKFTAQEAEPRFKRTRIDQLTHEMAVLKRLKFAASSEQLDAQQRSPVQDTIDADVAALEESCGSFRRATPKRRSRRCNRAARRCRRTCRGWRPITSRNPSCAAAVARCSSINKQQDRLIFKSRAS